MNDVKNYEANYGYYSKLLGKPFDTVEALVAAEKEEIAKRNAKQEKADAKKADAQKVEAAFKAANAAKRTFDTEVAEAQKACAKIIADAKAACAASIAESRKKLDAAENDYSKALKEFTAKHPEGYHMTFRDGDTVTNISRAEYDTMVHDFYNSILKLFDI